MQSEVKDTFTQSAFKDALTRAAGATKGAVKEREFLMAHLGEIKAARARGVPLKEISRLAAESGTPVSVFVLRSFLKEHASAKVSRTVAPEQVERKVAPSGFRVARDEDL